MFAFLFDMEKYVFREASGEYSKYFEAEKLKLLDLFDDSVKIEHVGSTAIPGLGGKGIVDIVVGVESGFESFKKKLEPIGYLFREHVSSDDRLFFRKEYDEERGVRRVHVHLVTFEGNEWVNLTAFRDYLLKHPETIEAYVALKKKAVKVAQGEGEVYRDFKKEFILEVIEKELIERKKNKE